MKYSTDTGIFGPAAPITYGEDDIRINYMEDSTPSYDYVNGANIRDVIAPEVRYKPLPGVQTNYGEDDAKSKRILFNPPDAVKDIKNAGSGILSAIGGASMWILLGIIGTVVMIIYLGSGKKLV